MRAIASCVLLGCSLAACSDSANTSSDTEQATSAHAGRAAADSEDDFKGCPEGVAEFEPGLRATGEHFAIVVLAAQPAKPERYDNDWTVQVGTLAGAAAEAEIVRGQTFMPIHGHDGRVMPQMTPLSELGQVQVDHLNFTMRGPWEVRFWLRSDDVPDDYVVFHVCVAK